LQSIVFRHSFIVYNVSPC